eukprot:CAMPEP_0171468968 /NCGR_PEP_ID=MMETSP0945-20130129/10964_1 /TAXON_ID=109269 /ORGANISM="Vaucheria litorea, Strain CCMP2940" /LENGTH=40 /DNA_ID= /DNA_START= /DNA_END= /DNA_ORIENTATION=
MAKFLVFHILTERSNDDVTSTSPLLLNLASEIREEWAGSV